MRMHNSRNGISPKHTLAQSQIEHEYTSDYGLFQKKKPFTRGRWNIYCPGVSKKAWKNDMSIGWIYHVQG